jgi:hypothetical protein
MRCVLEKRLDDGAFAGVVPTDNDGIRMKRDRVVETSIVLETKCAQHCSTCNEATCAGGG